MHTLQLAIQDGLKKSRHCKHDLQNLAEAAPKINEKLMKAGLLMAILDQEIRDGAALILWWNVSKEFINESVELNIRGVQLTAPQ